MRRPVLSILVPLLVSAALLSGCAASGDSLAPDNSGSGQSGSQKNPPGATGPDDRANELTVYKFAGVLIGASPPARDRAGPAHPNQPPPGEAFFTAPEGTLALDFWAPWPTGNGQFRIEVEDATGALVYQSFTHTMVSAGAHSVSPRTWTYTMTAPDLGAGDYRVVYYVGGQFDASFTVTATLEDGS